MNNTSATYRDKGRAVFLAAIMVLSMVAMSAAFAAPAAAQSTGDATIDGLGAPGVTGGQDATNQSVTIQGVNVDDTEDILYLDISNATDAGVGLNFDDSGASSGLSTTALNETASDVSSGIVAVDVGSTASAPGATDVTVDLNLTTPNAEVEGITYTVENGDGSRSASDSFDHVVANSVGADNVDVTAGETSLFVNITHSESADDARLTLVSSVDDISLDDAGATNNNVAVNTSGATFTEYEVNLTDSVGDALPVGDYEVYAAAENSSDLFGAVSADNFQVQDTVSVGGLEVTDFTVPQVAGNDTTQTAEITLNNTGSSSVEQNVTFAVAANGSEFGANPIDLQDQSTFVDNFTVTDVSVGAGEEVTKTIQFDTGELNGASENPSYYDVAAFTQGSPFSGSVNNLLVGSGSEGSTSVTVVDEQGNTLNGIDVDLRLVGSSTTIRSAETNDQGRVTFNDLAVGSSDTNTIQYVAEVGANAGADFESTTTTLELYEPTQTSDSSTVTLRSALEPEVIGVGAFDSDAEEIVGDSRTLFGNGDFDNQGEFAVFAQTQSANEQNQPVNQEVEVDVAVVNDGTDDPLRFVDPDNAGENATTITLTIGPDSPTANVDGNDTTGVYSYETFSVTADNADDSTLDDPLTTEDFNVTTSDIGTRDVATDPDVTATSDSSVASGNGLQNSVTYVLEGEKQVTGDIRDSVSGADLSDVTLWAAYEGVENESLMFTEDTFVNAQGDSFLTAEATDSGNYVIDGIAGDSTNFTLYAVHDTNDRYNNINTSSEEVGFVAAANELQTTGSGTDDDTALTQDLVLTEEQVELEYRLDVTVDGEPVDDDKRAEITFEEQADVEVLVEERPEASNDPADWSAAANQEVDIQLADISTGTLEGTSISQGDLTGIDTETDEFGIATATFESGSASASTAGEFNVTALTESDGGVEFRAGDSAETSEATIEVFGSGEITGDVVDEDNNNFGGAPDNRATVQLFDLNDLDTPLQETTTGPEGSYTFSDVRTGNDYRVVASFDNETGFSNVRQLDAGTTNADIVITGTEAPTGFDVTALNPADVNVTQGDVIDVTATIENTAGQEDTQDVAFQVSNGSGTLVDVTQEVTIGAGQTTEVTFEDIDTAALAPGDYTHGAYPADGTELTATLTVEEDNSSSNGPQIADYTNADGDTTTDLLRQAIDDWRNDEIGTDLLRDVIDNWRNS